MHKHKYVKPFLHVNGFQQSAQQGKTELIIYVKDYMDNIDILLTCN